MKQFIILFLLANLFSCTNKSEECIEEMIVEFREENAERGFTFIYQFEQDGKTFYIFDSGIAFDATASVMDQECQVVCTYGGFRDMSPLSCDDFQESINSARQIWPD